MFEQFGRVFNEAEAWCAGVGKKETQVKAHTRKPRSGSMEEVVPEGTPVEVVEHRPEDRSCPKCGSDRKDVLCGEEFNIKELLVPEEVTLCAAWPQHSPSPRGHMLTIRYAATKKLGILFFARILPIR